VLLPRPPKVRRVEFTPNVTLFKPAGIPLMELDEVSLAVDELEAIRLRQLEGLDQEACAQRMRVSRPTFQRILNAGLTKVAEALVEGKAIRVCGGTYRLAKRQFWCRFCGNRFEVPFERAVSQEQIFCPDCNRGPAHPQGGRGRGGHRFRGGRQ